VAYYERSLQAADARGAAEGLGGLSLGAAASPPAAGQQQQRGGGGGGDGGDGGSLVREAAHNLARIYCGSGADGLARRVLRRYVRV
jgi:hypothetical protein